MSLITEYCERRTPNNRGHDSVPFIIGRAWRPCNCRREISMTGGIPFIILLCIKESSRKRMKFTSLCQSRKE